MKTIEIERQRYKVDKLTLDFLYKYILKYDDSFHFFFEPQLIIRTSYVREVKKTLKNLGIKYKVYDYPYPKKGFGESKQWKKIQRNLEKIYHLQAVSVLTSNKRETKFIANRLGHCYLNMRGFEFYTESKFYLGQAKGYLEHDYKSTGILSTWVLAKLMGGLYKLL